MKNSILRAIEWRSSVAVWSGGMSAGCIALKLFAGTGSGWPHYALRYH